MDDGPIMDGDEVAEFVDDLPDGWEDGLCPSCVEEMHFLCDICGENPGVSDTYHSTWNLTSEPSPRTCEVLISTTHQELVKTMTVPF